MVAPAVAKTAWDVSHVQVRTEDRGAAGLVVRVAGNATFLRLPKLLDALEALPADREVRPEVGGWAGWLAGWLRHLDHACATALKGWVAGLVRTTVS
ncbi:hypothetical protein ACFVJK_20395 [Streptomyces sp. NPDC127172]|uniref:hypothetical protein n=1 Tax=Streptomyces sp. NPDC127172 TaxID=3345382 RepID=UPI00363167AD